MKLFAKYFCKSVLSMKSNIIIVFFLSLISSFMYFFVQISIDQNLRILSSKKVLNSIDKEFLISLQSNKILAISFLIILSLITGFIYFMFYKKYYYLHQKEIGCYIALGYSAKRLACIVFIISISFISFAYIFGLCLGWIGSDVMLNLYKEVYSLEYLVKGLDIKNFFISFIISIILPTLSCLPIILKSNNINIIDLLRESSTNVMIHIGDFTCVLTKKIGFSFRLALQKPFQLLMLFLAVLFFTILFIMSFSLNLSSKYIFDTQSYGRNYKYDITFPDYQEPQNNSDFTYYLREPISLHLNNKAIDGTIMGIEDNSQLFLLVNKQKKPIINIPNNNIVISKALSELYNIQQGADIPIFLNNKSIIVNVYAIAENADNFTIYTSKNNLETLLNISPNSFNGIYAIDISKTWGKVASVKNISDRVSKLKENNVSNRISAVICQILGCIIGCLLLYLTILLKFQEDIKNIFILDMIGYTPKQINKMFISIYRPILNFGFIIFLIPSIKICNIIHRSLSLATNDYIPFKINFSIILLIWTLLNIFYSIVKYTFNLKISYIQKKGNVISYLS